MSRVTVQEVERLQMLNTPTRAIVATAARIRAEVPSLQLEGKHHNTVTKRIEPEP